MFKEFYVFVHVRKTNPNVVHSPVKKHTMRHSFSNLMAYGPNESIILLAERENPSKEKVGGIRSLSIQWSNIYSC